jgi:hypothetical protein
MGMRITVVGALLIVVAIALLGWIIHEILAEGSSPNQKASTASEGNSIA